MKRKVLLCAALLLCVFVAGAQPDNKYRGLDNIYDFSVSVDKSVVPEGYEPFYISHYGRHGSRYAYKNDFYDEPEILFSTAAKEGNLTAFGKKMAERFEKAYPDFHANMGLITDKGRQQQKMLARRMYESFPEVFPHCADVLAVSSSSMRSVISMASFCTGLAGFDSSLNIKLEQSRNQLCCTHPRDVKNVRNVNRTPAPELPVAMQETMYDFFTRTLDCEAVLSRLFKNPEKALKALEGRERNDGPVLNNRCTPASVVWSLWVFAAGTASLDSGIDFDDLFTPEEWITFWKADCYLRFREYYKYLDECCQVVEDIWKDCAAQVDCGGRGAKLRFGHDHVLLPVLSLLKIDHFADIPASPEDSYRTYPTWKVPMAANLQFVLYRNASNDVLVRILLNEEDVRLCTWAEFEKQCQDALAAFPKEL